MVFHEIVHQPCFVVTSHNCTSFGPMIWLVIVACGISLQLRWPAGRWKPCGIHTGCLQVESVLAWLAACWWAWTMCSRFSQGARKQHGTDRRLLQTDASDYQYMMNRLDVVQYRITVVFFLAMYIAIHCRACAELALCIKLNTVLLIVKFKICR